MGIWPDDEDKSNESMFAAMRLPIMICAIFFCMFLPQMYALALNIYEMPLVIDNLMTSCSAFTSCIKLYFLWHSKKSNIKFI